MTEGEPGLREAPADVDLGRVWTSVATQVWRRQPGWLERAAGWAAALARAGPGPCPDHAVAAGALADR